MVCYVVCDFRQVLAFLHLARWLQLYVVGDAENAEVELAEELAGVYSAAFGKGGALAIVQYGWAEKAP